MDTHPTSSQTTSPQTTSVDVDIQISDTLAEQAHTFPSEHDLNLWISEALKTQNARSLTHQEISIRITDEQESAELNFQYRHKNSSTNILSFPADIPDYINSPLLGDLLICAPVLEREAKEQNKTLTSHWAHIIVHGTLHLLGYDHIHEQEAATMETLEIEILKNLGISNPYS
jgi:probable rRNA maturation factor